MKALTNCGKIEIRESPVEGYGVFATEDINAGTVLEEVPFVLFPRYTNISKGIFDVLKANGLVNSKELYLENLRGNLQFKEPEKYYFKWHPRVQLDTDTVFTVLPLGFGPIYNTSNTDNNADWKMLENTFVFKAEKDIKKDEEIRTFYGYFLGQDGTIFPCESVFHFAIDTVTNQPNTPVNKLKMLRFGTVDSFNTQRNNPSAHKIHQLITKSSDGLEFKKIEILQPDGKSVVTGLEILPSITLSQLYQRLAEAKNHPAPVVRFEFKYIDKVTKEEAIDFVFWKK